MRELGDVKDLIMADAKEMRTDSKLEKSVKRRVQSANSTKTPVRAKQRYEDISIIAIPGIVKDFCTEDVPGTQTDLPAYLGVERPVQIHVFWCFAHSELLAKMENASIHVTQRFALSGAIARTESVSNVVDRVTVDGLVYAYTINVAAWLRDILVIVRYTENLDNCTKRSEQCTSLDIWFDII